MLRTIPAYLIATLLLFSVTVVGQESAEMDAEPMEPRQSFFVCDWGLLTIEHPAAQDDVFITIENPANYSPVSSSSFTVSGQGAGLFEGNVVVEVRIDGELVLTEPTILQAEELGAVGDWSLDVELDGLDEATAITVTAYSPSPEDGSVIASDSIQLNLNSVFGLPFVTIERPFGSAGVSASPLLVEGMAGSAFENNIVIEVQDVASGEQLAETFATIQTEELGGRGPFSAEVDLDVEPGTLVAVTAYQPAIADDEDVTISDTQFAVISPLARTYDRFLVIRPDDPLNQSDDVCGPASTEFQKDNIQLLAINDVQVISTRSMMPLVNVAIDAAGSSVCPAPLRTRATRDGDAFAIETYYDLSEPVACSADLAPIPQRISLGTLESPDYTITVNGEVVD